MPSSLRKHLAESLRRVRGPLARQQRQHARLSECATAQSTALGCQITLKWTAATSMSTPSVCHDAAIHVAHHTLEHRAGRGGDRGRGAEKREIESACICGGFVPFIWSYSPDWRTSSALTCCLETKSPSLPSPH